MNVCGPSEFSRSSSVSSDFALGELVQRLARISLRMIFFSSLDFVGEWEVSEF